MAGKTCCCGCCSVRDGTRIIAVLWIISAAYTMGQEVHSIMVMSQDPKQIADSYAVSMDDETRVKLEEFVREHQTGIIIYFAVGLVFALIQLILSGLLFGGAQTNQESRCRPWLLYNFFLFAVMCIFLIFITILMMIFASFFGGIIFALILAIPVAIEAYFLNVVREYMLELRYGGSGGQGVVYAPGNPHQNMI